MKLEEKKFKTRKELFDFISTHNIVEPEVFINKLILKYSEVEKIEKKK